MTVDAAPAFGEQGLSINTALSNSGTTLTVGGQQYRFANSGGYDDVVQLDETTLAPVASGTHSAVTPKDGTVTIGAWQDANGVPFTNGTFGSAVWIGTKLVALNDSINNTDPSAGNQNTTLTGWIKPGTTNTAHTMTTGATWVGSHMRPTQTRSKSDTTTTNTMVVGSANYPVSLPSGATGGYELLELDNDGDAINARQLYALDGDAADDLATQHPMSNFDPKQIWTSGTDQWWPALNSSKAPYQDGVAVPKSITDLLFSPFDATQGPQRQRHQRPHRAGRRGHAVLRPAVPDAGQHAAQGPGAAAPADDPVGLLHEQQVLIDPQHAACQAQAAGGFSSRRSLTPSFCIARYRCVSTVRTESTSRSAISALLKPSAARPTS